MLRFPSIPTAILTGALWMPFFIWTLEIIERSTGSQLILILWSFVGFMLPVLLSTSDLRYMRDRMRAEGSLLGKLRASWARPEDFQLFFVPAWKRISVLFLSTALSVLFLKFFGINP